MATWISHLFAQHDRLLQGGVGDVDARVYAPTTALWNAFAQACFECADSYGQFATGAFRNRPVLIRRGASDLSLQITIGDPNHSWRFSELFFDKHHTYIKVVLPDSDKSAIQIPIVMTKSGELVTTYGGRLISVEEAARLVMTPILFGMQSDLEIAGGPDRG